MTHDDNITRLPVTPAPRAVVSADPPVVDDREGKPYRTFCCFAAEGDDMSMHAFEDLEPQQWRFWEAYDDHGTVDAIAELLIAPNTSLEHALAAVERIRLALIAEYEPDPRSAA